MYIYVYVEFQIQLSGPKSLFSEAFQIYIRKQADVNLKFNFFLYSICLH